MKGIKKSPREGEKSDKIILLNLNDNWGIRQALCIIDKKLSNSEILKSYSIA